MTQALNTTSLHVKISPELHVLLKSTGEPTTFTRELLMKHFNITDSDIKQSRKEVNKGE